MTQTTTPADDMAAQQRMGDAVMAVAMLLYALGAVVLGWVHDQPGLPWLSTLLWTAALLAPGLIGLLALRGTLASRLLLAFSLSALVALHIQVSAGMIEFHFGVFVTLALLMVYLDWRVIVFSAALFAAHHIGFDRLHALGFGVYCLPEPNFGVVLLHAVYVVVQTGLQVFLVLRLARFVRDNSEVALLASSIQDGERIALDLSAVHVQAPLATQLKHNLARMASAVATVRSAAENLQSASTEIAGGNLDLSQRTEQTANRLQETSGSLGQLNAGAKQSVDAALQARQLAESATTTAVRGGEVVGQVVHTMSAINQSSEKIRDIIGVIDGIAFQTNILALNAAVEAARAGEAGRGFAVVAAEVRQLAQRSAQAAREIKELINTSVDRVQSGGQQVQLAGQTMEELVASVKRVTDIIAEISASSHEQSQGIHHVNEAVAEVDQMTQQNAALVEQSTAATESLKEQALRLIHAMTVFRLEGAQSAGRAGAPPALEWRH